MRCLIRLGLINDKLVGVSKHCVNFALLIKYGGVAKSHFLDAEAPETLRVIVWEPSVVEVLWGRAESQQIISTVLSLQCDLIF